MKRRVLAYVCVLLLLCLLCACSGAPDFAAGTPMTPQELAALKDELTGGEVPEVPAKPSEPTAPTEVFWLGSGSVYHKDVNCYHIKEKPNVTSGTVEAALAAGKKKLCSHCGAN